MEFLLNTSISKFSNVNFFTIHTTKHNHTVEFNVSVWNLFHLATGFCEMWLEKLLNVFYGTIFKFYPKILLLLSCIKIYFCNVNGFWAMYFYITDGWTDYIMYLRRMFIIIATCMFFSAQATYLQKWSRECMHTLFKYTCRINTQSLTLWLIATYKKNCKTINFKFGIVIPLML